MSRARSFAVLAALAALGGCARLEQEAPLAEVRRGRFEKTLTVTGRLAASETLSVTSEAYGKIAFMATEGSRVNAGDPLFGLETKEMEDQLQNALLDLAISEANLAKAAEELRSDAVRAELTRREKESQLAWAKLKAERSRTELERKRRQVENRILPRRELASAELEAEQGDLEVRNAEIDAERWREESASRGETLEFDRQSAQARLEKTRSQVDEARDYLDKATVEAPRAGVVVHSKGWRGTFKVGDEVWDGVAVMELPDLSAMEVALEIHEVDISQLSIGLPARIRVEAFPELELAGKLTEIQGLAKELKDDEGKGIGVRVFDAVVAPDVQDDRLRPGMTARVEIVLERHDDVLLAPVAAIRREDGGARVTLASGEERDVEVIATDADAVAIRSGLSEGDRVRIVAPEPAEAPGLGASGAALDATAPAASAAPGGSTGGGRGGRPPGAGPRGGRRPGPSVTPP